MIYFSDFNAGGYQGPPFFVADGGATGSTAWTSGAVSYPAGLQANDIAFIHINFPDGLSSPGGQTISTPSGWDLVDSQSPVAVGGHTTIAYVFWRRLDGSESGSVTLTASENSNTGCVRAVMSIFRGCVTTGTPYEDADKLTFNNTSTPLAPSVTTTAANRLVCAFFGVNDDPTFTTPSTWDKEYEYASLSGNDGNIALFTKVVASASTEAGCQPTLSTSNDGGVIFALGLIPENP